MTDQIEGQRTLVSLRIDAKPLYEGQLDVQFTGLDAAGDPLLGSVTMLTEHVRDLHDATVKAAATMTAAPLGSFGGQDQPKVIFDVAQDQAAGLQFVFTVAYATGAEDYRPPSLAAPVTSAALSRLAQGLDQILQGGQGVVNWTVAE